MELDREERNCESPRVLITNLADLNDCLRIPRADCKTKLFSISPFFLRICKVFKFQAETDLIINIANKLKVTNVRNKNDLCGVSAKMILMEDFHSDFSVISFITDHTGIAYNYKFQIHT